MQMVREVQHRPAPPSRWPVSATPGGRSAVRSSSGSGRISDEGASRAEGRSDTETPHDLTQVLGTEDGGETIPASRGGHLSVQEASPQSRSSDFRELAGLNQLNQHVPFVIGQYREIAGLTDPNLVARELHLRALAASCGAQQHFPVVHCIHLLPFTIFSRSM